MSPSLALKKNINKPLFSFYFSVKLGNKCLNNAKITNVPACDLKRSVCTAEPSVSVSSPELLLGNNEEF